MKSAATFLFGMYFHLLCSIAVPVILWNFCLDGYNAVGIGAILFYILEIVIVHILGWICVGCAASAYFQNKKEALKKGWKLLKLSSIPFYAVNFIYSAFIWFLLIGASRGIFFLLLPIPFGITCLMIFQSGCVGICHIMLMRRQCMKNSQGMLSSVHYLLQLIPILDIISTLLLLRRDSYSFFKISSTSAPQSPS